MTRFFWFISCFAYFDALYRVFANTPVNETNNGGFSENISFPTCNISCHCESIANPLYKLATVMAKKDISDVTLNVKSLCMNEHNGCLSSRQEYCEQINVTSSTSFLFLALLESNRNSQLQVLCLSNKKLTCIEALFFEQSYFINALILNHNFINNTNWIKELSNSSLFYLDLSFNRLTSLENKAFENVKELIWLDLRHNYIEAIPPQAFDGLRKLQLLDLSSNSLSVHHIYENAFGSLSNLLHLSLANNRGISSLPDFVMIGLDKTRLETLDLHGLRLSPSIDPFAFSGLDSLVTLNLSFCGLMDLKVGWLSNGPEKALRTLDLSHNLLVQLKSSYFVAHRINEEWKRSIEDFSKFDPSTRPYVVTPSVNVKYSDIYPINYKECLLLSQSSEFYEPLPNLSWLSLSNNMFLNKIEENVFNYLPKLQYLFLQKCNITKLKIANSSNQYMNDGISTTLPLLGGVWMWGNPLNCDCHVRVLLHWATSDESFNNTKCWNSSEIVHSNQRVNSDTYLFNDRCKTVHSPGNIICLLGHSRTQIQIKDVPYSALTCPEEPISIFVVLLIGPLTFAISVVLMALCGFCAVTFGRIRRYQSGFYATKSMETREHTAVNATLSPIHKEVKKGSGPHIMPIKTRRNPETSFSFTPNPSPRLSRPYRTNLVLGKLGEKRSRSVTESLRSSNQGNSPLPSPRMRASHDRRPSTNKRHHFHRFHLSPMKGFHKSHKLHGKHKNEFVSIPKTEKRDCSSEEHSSDDDKQSFLHRETQFLSPNLQCEAET